jgi:cobalt-zinc-cadmium efflux system protein
VTAHNHSHSAPGTGGGNRTRLILAIGIIAVGLIAQFTGTVLSGSLALLADAGHMFSDLAGLVIALIAIIAAKPATDRRTYGYQRAEVLAAMVNGVVLTGVALYVSIEAIGRLISTDTEPVASVPMLVVALVGGLANLAALLVLRAGAGDSINMRGAYLEVLGDLLGSAAVVIAALVILFTGFSAADSIASLLIAAMIVPRAFSLLRDVFAVLFESVPAGTDIDQVRSHMLDVPGVIGVHDVHMWQITHGSVVFTAHVVVAEPAAASCASGQLLDQLVDCLHEHFDVAHSTFQIEPADHADHEKARHR